MKLSTELLFEKLQTEFTNCIHLDICTKIG